MKHAIHRRSMKPWYFVLALNLSIGLCLTSGTAIAQEAIVKSLMSKDLKDFPGKEGLLIAVEYPPRGYRPYTSSQCTRICICAGGLHRHAAERRKRSYTDTRTDFL